MLRAFRLASFALALALAACAKAPPPADETSLRALDAAYRDAWLAQDATAQEKAVLALFDKDAVIMPGGGVSPEIGVSSLKQFWFPDGAPATEVTHFDRQIDKVDIAGDLGVVSGRYTLGFTFDNQSVSQAGNYLFVARNTGDGWRIIRMIWNDQPLTDV